VSGAAPITGDHIRHLAQAAKGNGGPFPETLESILLQLADQLDARPTGIEAQVCDDIARRQALGVQKYGTTLEANGAGLLDRLQHAYEEMLDGANYLKWAMSWVSSTRPSTLYPPQGYFHRYPCGVVLYNNGEEVNGARPIEAIPFWLGSMSDTVDHHPSRIFRAGYRSALMAYRPDLVDAFNLEWPQDDPASPSTVSILVNWQRMAVAWLRGKAADQAKINEAYPRHVQAYPSWQARVDLAQKLADELERETTAAVAGAVQRAGGSV